MDIGVAILGIGIPVSLIAILILAMTKPPPKAAAAEHEASLERLRARHAAHLREIRMSAEAHKTTLARKHRQLVTQDDYGVWHYDAWWQELGYFVRTVLEIPAENVIYADAVLEVDKVAIEERRRWEAEAPLLFDWESLSPADFEHACAVALRESGWEARVVGSVGDQGADLVASRAGVTVVLQCKLYSSTVGNGAVQEVHAARTYYGADAACVVSNAGFTIAARRLAATTGTLLLAPDDLSDLAALLGLSDEG